MKISVTLEFETRVSYSYEPAVEPSRRGRPEDWTPGEPENIEVFPYDEGKTSMLLLETFYEYLESDACLEQVRREIERVREDLFDCEGRLLK